MVKGHLHNRNVKRAFILAKYNIKNARRLRKLNKKGKNRTNATLRRAEGLI